MEYRDVHNKSAKMSQSTEFQTNGMKTQHTKSKLSKINSSVIHKNQTERSPSIVDMSMSEKDDARPTRKSNKKHATLT